VVGHDNETASEPTVSCRAVEKECSQTFECGFVVQNVRVTIHAQREEVGDVAVAIRPDPMETAEAVRGRFVRCGNRDAV
jgi:hypothetical protein